MASPGTFPDRPRQVIGGTLVVAAVVAGFGAACLLWNVLFLLFIGVVLAMALKPVIDATQRRGVRQPLAVGAVYAWIFLVFLLVMIFGIPAAIDRAREVVGKIPRADLQARQWLANAGDVYWAKIARRLIAEDAVSRAIIEPEESLQTFGRTASFLGMAVRGLLAGGVVVLLAFYWSLQRDRTILWLLLLLPGDRRDAARDTIAEIESKVGAYLRGQGLVCVAMAIMAAIVYSILGLQGAIELGLIAGLLEVMPVLGPMVGAVPPLCVALFTAPGKTPWVLAAAIAMQQVEGYVIVPRIMDKSVGVHPMVTLLAIAAFGSLFGIAGAVLAIPLAAIAQVLLNSCLLVPAATQPEAPSGRGALSVLHYDAQELLRDIRLRDKAEPAAQEFGHLAEAIEAIARDLDRGLMEIEGRAAAEGLP